MLSAPVSVPADRPTEPQPAHILDVGTGLLAGESPLPTREPDFQAPARGPCRQSGKQLHFPYRRPQARPLTHLMALPPPADNQRQQ
jgi:hypothetical protein